MARDREMTRLHFNEIPTPVPGMTMYAAARGNFTYMISVDHQCADEVRASIKVIGSTPFDGTRHDLGVFASVRDAMRACDEWKSQ
jgi:hypothetical protein